MDCTRSTSSEWLLVCLAITAMFPVVWSAPISPNHPSTTQTKRDLENVGNILVMEADKLYSEICVTPNLCENSDEHLLKEDLKLPEIKDIKSGCLSTNFDKKTCLPKIYRDLLSFQTYLDYLKESMSNSKNIIDSMQVQSLSLAENVKLLDENLSKDNENTTPSSTVIMKPRDDWNKKRTNSIILKSFKEYMEKTVRALRNIVKSR